MDNLSIEQLKIIPWNRKYISGEDVPPEPLPEEIPDLIKIPFIQRDKRYCLFYIWLEIIRMIDNQKSLKILDAACGRGQICQVLHFYGHDVIGADINNYFCGDDNIKFIQADLDKRFPFEDDTFDIVINSTALHYLQSSPHFFNETKRILKNNGKVIFSIPNISNLGSRYYFFKTGKISEFSSAILERKNFTYPDYIFELLKSLNFEVEKISGNVPIINFKIKIVDLIFGKVLFGDNNIISKFANTLIIKAVINKDKYLS